MLRDSTNRSESGETTTVHQYKLTLEYYNQASFIIYPANTILFNPYRIVKRKVKVIFTQRQSINPFSAENILILDRYKNR